MIIPFIAAIFVIVAVIYFLSKASKKDNQENLGEQGRTM
jgi:hypothetical protein